MNIDQLAAICPLDGRYADQIAPLRELFCEHNLIKERISIEIAWLKMLSAQKKIVEVPPFSKKASLALKEIIDHFSMDDALAVKKIESKINHDVKAVEYFLKEKLAAHREMRDIKEFVHFGATSEDINNLCYALMLKKARKNILLPALKKLIQTLSKLANRFSKQPMVSRTHGQPATPTTLGKELANTAYRLNRQYQLFLKQPILGKMNGAVGNYNAHYVAYPDIHWEKVAEKFVKQFGIDFNPYTTQIEPHDYMAEFYQNCIRINTIVMDLCRNLWGYISLGYFSQNISSEVVGSSTMPHKINPIHFENAEGNLGLSNALLGHFAEKLPLSRFQRDLTDSTVLRNIGVGLGHSLLGLLGCQEGLSQLKINRSLLKAELENHWILLAEPIQMLMRRYGLEKPYEKLKALTQGKKGITKAELHEFITDLDLPKKEKERLLKLSPKNYFGQASELAENFTK